MDAQVFWNVIGNYNEKTWLIQMALLIFVLLAVILSYMRKVKWAAKFALGIANLFIGIVFFAWYGTEYNAGYKRKNKVLLVLLTIWGLTGIKSIIFNVYEDIILLICGLYGVVLLVNELEKSKKG